MKTTIAKMFSLILAAALCVSFAACSQSEPEDDTDGSSGSTPESQPISAEDDGESGDDTAETEGNASEPEPDVTEPEENVTEPEESAAPEDDTGGEDEIPERDGETETSVIIPDEGQNAGSDKGKAIAETAMSAVGYDFLFGGDSPEDGGFDNSGLIYYALTENGISCPRQLGGIMEIGAEVGYDELSMGDPVFFKLDDEGTAVYGGVYAGDGKAVMSLSEDIPVKLVDITSDYYRSNFLCGVRAVS